MAVAPVVPVSETTSIVALLGRRVVELGSRARLLERGIHARWYRPRWSGARKVGR